LTRIRLMTAVLIAALLPLCCHAQFPPAPGTGPGLPETIEAMDAARVTTRILYITAHPDDESGAVLTYLARGLHADVALLSITRGEGGQNALGPEQAPQLGLIRTQELLAATRGYGAKLYFTRAKDFGFSKTPEETQKIWGDAVMQDMVRVIREFRPHIVINGWGGVHTGHGHHQTAGLWTPQAVKFAADAKYLGDPDFAAWDNNGQGVKILDVERGSDNPKGYALPVDDISPLYGKSYREIGLDAFVNHHTQGIAGFLNSPFLRRPVALLPEDGSKLDPSSLGRTLVSINIPIADRPCSASEKSCASLTDAEREIAIARTFALSLDWKSAAEALSRSAKDLAAVKSSIHDSGAPWTGSASVDLMKAQDRLNRALALVLGVHLTAEAESADLVAGEPLEIKARARCRVEAGCVLGELSLLLPAGIEEKKSGGDLEKGFQFTIAATKSDFQPDTRDLLQPEGKRLVTAQQTVAVDAYTFMVEEPAVHTVATSTSVNRVLVRVVPAYTLSVEPRQSVEVLNQSHKRFEVYLRIHSYSTKSARVSVGLEAPDGFTASAPVELPFDGTGDQYARLIVTPPAKLEPGNYALTAYARRGDEKFATTLEPLPTAPTILWSEPAQTVVHAFDITVPPDLRVGYISAEGEMIPDALRRLGITVEMLDANAVNFGDLSKYSAIVVGVRAYELRPELASANKRLLDYASNGGTLVVQYNRDYIWNRILPAPYHAAIGNPTPRITDENAEVKFVQPDDRLLKWPNKITSADFQGWVQERGLYYWSDFDSKYTALLAMHDPGESDLTGGLVYTRFGKGTYIYTGLAFFRELPEGVPGAYRLFVNLLSASQK